MPDQRKPSEQVHLGLSHDIVTACKELLQAAEAGQLIGLSITAFFTRRRYLVDVIGEPERDPVFARGVLCALDDCLREIDHKRHAPTTL